MACRVSPARIPGIFRPISGGSKSASRQTTMNNPIEYHWRIYPKVLDAKKTTAARVQASLRLTHNALQ